MNSKKELSVEFNKMVIERVVKIAYNQDIQVNVVNEKYYTHDNCIHLIPIWKKQAMEEIVNDGAYYMLCKMFGIKETRTKNEIRSMLHE